MSRKPLFDPFSDSRQADLFIKKNTGFRLINFSHALAEILMESFWGPPLLGSHKGSIFDELDSIEKIYSDTIQALTLFCSKHPIFEDYEKLVYEKERRNFVIAKFNLLPFLKALLIRQEELKTKLSFFPIKSKGSPIRKIYKIASLWAVALKKNNQISWNTIVLLINWFYNRLGSSEYGTELRMSADIRKSSEQTKKQCSRLFCHEDHVKTIVSSSGFFFPTLLRHGIYFRPKAIIFEKNGIKVCVQNKDVMISRRLEIRNGKRYVSITEEKINNQKDDRPCLVFPNGETYYSGRTLGKI